MVSQLCRLAAARKIVRRKVLSRYEPTVVPFITLNGALQSAGCMAPMFLSIARYFFTHK